MPRKLDAKKCVETPSLLNISEMATVDNPVGSKISANVYEPYELGQIF